MSSTVEGRAADMEGFLYKQGGLGQESNRHVRRVSQALLSAGAGVSGTLYRKRWFRLFGTTLRYSAAPDGKELGFLDISELSDISAPKPNLITCAADGDVDEEAMAAERSADTPSEEPTSPPDPSMATSPATLSSSSNHNRATSGGSGGGATSGGKGGGVSKSMPCMELRFTGRMRVHRLGAPGGEVEAERWRQALVNASFLTDDGSASHAFANPMISQMMMSMPMSDGGAQGTRVGTANKARGSIGADAEAAALAAMNAASSTNEGGSRTGLGGSGGGLKAAASRFGGRLSAIGKKMILKGRGGGGSGTSGESGALVALTLTPEEQAAREASAAASRARCSAVLAWQDEQLAESRDGRVAGLEDGEAEWRAITGNTGPIAEFASFLAPPAELLDLPVFSAIATRLNDAAAAAGSFSDDFFGHVTMRAQVLFLRRGTALWGEGLLPENDRCGMLPCCGNVVVLMEGELEVTKEAMPVRKVGNFGGYQAHPETEATVVLKAGNAWGLLEAMGVEDPAANNGRAKGSCSAAAATLPRQDVPCVSGLAVSSSTAAVLVLPAALLRALCFGIGAVQPAVAAQLPPSLRALLASGGIPGLLADLVNARAAEAAAVLSATPGMAEMVLALGINDRAKGEGGIAPPKRSSLVRGLPHSNTMMLGTPITSTPPAHGAAAEEDGGDDAPAQAEALREAEVSIGEGLAGRGGHSTLGFTGMPASKALRQLQRGLSLLEPMVVQGKEAGIPLWEEAADGASAKPCFFVVAGGHIADRCDGGRAMGAGSRIGRLAGGDTFAVAAKDEAGSPARYRTLRPCVLLRWVGAPATGGRDSTCLFLDRRVARAAAVRGAEACILAFRLVTVRNEIERVVLGLPICAGLAQPLAHTVEDSAAFRKSFNDSAEAGDVTKALAAGRPPLHVLSSLLLPRWLEAGESIGTHEERLGGSVVASAAFVIVASGELTASLEGGDGSALFTVSSSEVCFTESTHGLRAHGMDDGSWGGHMAAVGVSGSSDGNDDGGTRLLLTPTRRSLVLLLRSTEPLALIATSADRNIGVLARGISCGGLLPRLARLARLQSEYGRGASAAAAGAASCLDALGTDQILALATHLDAVPVA